MGCDVNDLSLMQDDEITNDESLSIEIFFKNHPEN